MNGTPSTIEQQDSRSDTTSVVNRVLDRLGRERGNLVPILQAVQGELRYLPTEALEDIAVQLGMTFAEVMGVATFYSQFRLRPAGEHTIAVCTGTACHVRGATMVYEALKRNLAIPDGDDTDPDRRFTLERVACLGCCTLAPAVKIGDITYGPLRPDRVDAMIANYLTHTECKGGKPSPAAPPAPDAEAIEFRLGLGSCCISRGSDAVRQALEQTLRETGIRARIKRVGCVGMCHQTPLVEVVKNGEVLGRYARVSTAEMRRIVLRHVSPPALLGRVRETVTTLLDRILTDEDDPPDAYAIDIRDPQVSAFLGPQRHIAVERCGEIDPLDIDEYETGGGFAALRETLGTLSPDTLIERIQASGLRGRGGAGFPAGRKWALVRAEPGENKVVIANGDEGDPGAFMDRMILESYPYRVLEGLALAAYAVGAREGILYIRAEYPLAVRRVREAIAVCESRGLLGDNLPGSGTSLHVRVAEGAGAFVCGEETGLIASLEGKRGHPRLRPPYPSQHGYQGRPTLVNNVETLATVPWIVRNGPDAFAAIGTDTSRGTKVFALAGKIKRGGLIEVPIGTTVREIVEHIGGGVGEGRCFKAAQIGGPSGGCIPAALGDTPVDYESLTDHGAMMGSGGFVVLDDSDCMVDIARYFLEFTQAESCGRCTPCRIGTRRMLEILERICGGEGDPGDLERLEATARNVSRGSLCALGQTAPNPVLSTLAHFRDEYEAHLQGRCPSGRCRALIRYAVSDRCIGCTLCARACPVDAISGLPRQRHEIDPAICVRCGACRGVCPESAIEIETGRPEGDAPCRD